MSLDFSSVGEKLNVRFYVNFIQEISLAFPLQCELSLKCISFYYTNMRTCVKDWQFHSAVVPEHLCFGDHLRCRAKTKPSRLNCSTRTDWRKQREWNYSPTNHKNHSINTRNHHHHKKVISICCSGINMHRYKYSYKYIKNSLVPFDQGIYFVPCLCAIVRWLGQILLWGRGSSVGKTLY